MMSGEVILPNLAPAEELAAAYRLQQQLIDQFNAFPYSLLYPGGKRAEFLAFRCDWENRLHGLNTRINELREIVEPVHPGEEGNGPEQVARTARKLAARKSTVYDAALQNYPLLVSKPIEAVEFDPLENFLAPNYTEVDPNSHITVDSATQITSVTTRGETAYVAKDYGVGFFGNYTHTYDFRITGSSEPVGGTCAAMICSKATVLAHYGANPQDIAGCSAYWSNNVYGFALRQFLNGALAASDAYYTTPTVGTDYYCTETRVGSAVSLEVYSAATRLPGELLDTLTIDDDGTLRRFSMAVVSWHSTYIYDWIGLITRNLDLQLSGSPFFFHRFVLGRRD